MKIIVNCLPLIILVIGKIIIRWYDYKIDKGIDELTRQSKRKIVESVQAEAVKKE